MIIVKVPATSANLGPGFDTLGVALSLYNKYIVDLSDDLEIIGIDDNYCNKNNLFVLAFDKVCKILGSKKTCKVIFDEINIPFCRGLGSSANLLIAGAYSANVLLNGHLSNNDLLNICLEFENHPDNIAPCIFGGLVMSFINDGSIISKKIKIANNIFPMVIIPKYEVKTEEARTVIKKEISINDAVYNIAHALFVVNSFESGDLELLKLSIEDKLHVPYRKQLIKEYDVLKQECLDKGSYGFTISGSGSTMISFSNNNLFSKKIKEFKNLDIYDLEFDNQGIVQI